MAVEALVAAEVSQRPGSKYKVGDVADLRSSADLVTRPWGAAEQSPSFVQIFVPDASFEQAQQYLTNWRTAFQFEVLATSPEGARLKVSVHPSAINSFGKGRFAMRDEMRLWLEEIGATIVSNDLPESLTADVPDADDPAVRQRLHKEFDDHFIAPIEDFRYHFTLEDVQAAVVQGGRIELTRAQVQQRIVDRLG